MRMAGFPSRHLGKGAASRQASHLRARGCLKAAAEALREQQGREDGSQTGGDGVTTWSHS